MKQDEYEKELEKLYNLAIKQEDARTALDLLEIRRTQGVDNTGLKLVEAIWKDLCDRRGFDLDSLDEEIQHGIQQSWIKIIKEWQDGSLP